VARDNAVAQVALLVEPKVGCAVRHECIELDERFRVEQQFESLARSQLSTFVLLVDASLTPTQQGLLA
jgi:hypothetical protein